MESKDGDVATAASEPSETSHLLLLLGEPLRCGARQAALDFIRQGLRRWDGGVVGGADLSAAMDAVANAKPKPSKIERTPGMICDDDSLFSCLCAFYPPSLSFLLFRCVLASLYEGLSVRPSVRPSVRGLVTLSSKTGKSMILIANNDVSCNHIIIQSFNHHEDASLALWALLG